MRPTLDVIIPCYNSAATLQAAVESAVSQPAVENVWLIDDASIDDTRLIMSDLAAIHPKVRCEYMLENGGAAKARNWGAMQSQADFIAFLDADDVYENNVLNAAYLGLEAYSYLSLVRLKLRPIGFPEHYLNHPQFPTAWERLQMTVGGNTVFRRSIFLACGGFPQDELFRIFGGEDAALGIALTRDSVVGYLFEERDPAVRHNYRPGIHAERLLDAELFGKTVPGLTIDHQNEAEAVTRRISRRLQEVKAHSTFEEAGTMPLYPEYE
ncbi:MAG: glycosyltransferase family A protein [Neisseria sp.]|jgi:glycosyltransferase, group 2 family|uniref:glycosyltransferase family 2 protein n=1 Tax=Neisseria TaxID=482 RepID=UPI00066507B2|nr:MULTISPECIES: glycosyltransferase family A protein [Neisseria]MBF1291473.1 glycosyltransferase family 2 protein [Neisseria sicca]MDU1533921.1 glycosyltransferase family A protein [Neisseria sp.]OFL95640.1 glycosyltransferase [Neisseria sp. HMSC074B07]OHR76729.1 glycosyltransferase [Neisseria sp. HMSC70E02]